MVSSFHSHRGFSPVLTKEPNLEPFQRFSKVRDMKTVKTVPLALSASNTGLKPGVNEKNPQEYFSPRPIVPVALPTLHAAWRESLQPHSVTSKENPFQIESRTS
jgi:hypothetical protein